MNNNFYTEQFTDKEIDTDNILQYFSFNHLPPKLRERSRPFHALARDIVDNCPRCPERSVALRKLLEAKDAAVRCGVDRAPSPSEPALPLESADEVKSEN